MPARKPSDPAKLAHAAELLHDPSLSMIQIGRIVGLSTGRIDKLRRTIPGLPPLTKTRKAPRVPHQPHSEPAMLSQAELAQRIEAHYRQQAERPRRMPVRVYRSPAILRSYR